MRKFNIYSKGTIVGQSQLETKGLYHHIRCNCQFDKDGIYKIIASGDSGTISLGTCIPKDNGYFLEKKISVRSIGDKELSFYVAEDAKECGQIISLSEDKAFALIDRLDDCILVKRSGSLGVILKEKGSTQQGNDQTQEYENGFEHP